MAIMWKSRKHSWRFKKAEIEYEKAKKIKSSEKIEDRIFKCVIACMNDLGLDTTKINRIDDVKQYPPYDKEFYKRLKQDFCLKDSRDLVWFKFTRNGFLGVVATSNDINFDIPKSKEDYLKREKAEWLYNFSGSIIHHLQETWNEDFVWVFPLINMDENKINRNIVEMEIGDCLINEGIPILDFYSHRL